MRRLICTIVTVALCLSLVGCGQQTDDIPATAAPEPMVLEVVTSYGGDDGNRNHFENAVASFEENTGYTVRDVSAVSNEEWKTSVLNDFITGSEPDVLFYFSNADADPLIHAGKVVSIEEIREEYPDYATNMKPSMMTRASDGLHYAVPSTGYWEGMFVNTEVLDACGIALPGPDYTWEQFLADCTRIKSNGYVPIAGSLFEIPHYWFEFLVLNNGSVSTHSDNPVVNASGHLVENDTAHKWIAALEDLRFLYESGFFPSNTLTATDAETVTMFAEGEAAFLVDGSWKVGYLSENYPEQLDNYVVSYFPGKGDRPASDGIAGISMGYFITRKAWENPEKRDAAVKFIFHMTSEEVLSTFVTTEYTALISGAKPADLNVLQKSAAEYLSSLTASACAVQDGISSEAKRELFSSIQKVVTGRMDPKAAVETAMKLN